MFYDQLYGIPIHISSNRSGICVEFSNSVRSHHLKLNDRMFDTTIERIFEVCHFSAKEAKDELENESIVSETTAASSGIVDYFECSAFDPDNLLFYLKFKYQGQGVEYQYTIDGLDFKKIDWALLVVNSYKNQEKLLITFDPCTYKVFNIEIEQK